MNAPVHWTEIDPLWARRIILPDPDIIGPIDEAGLPCPWPWIPQQLTNTPMGMCHCTYCGSMCLAGLPHPDYSVMPEDDLYPMTEPVEDMQWPPE